MHEHEAGGPRGRGLPPANYGVCCAQCAASIDVRTMEDCIECSECGLTYCDNCYDTNLGDGCHCHGSLEGR